MNGSREEFLEVIEDIHGAVSDRVKKTVPPSIPEEPNAQSILSRAKKWIIKIISQFR